MKRFNSKDIQELTKQERPRDKRQMTLSQVFSSVQQIRLNEYGI